MSKVFLIRHGEPAWEMATQLGLRARDREFVPLSSRGVGEIREVARDHRLKTAGAVVCSPYPRTLQSAAVLAQNLNLELFPEYGLHEWWYHPNPGHHMEPGPFGELWASIVRMNGTYPPPEERDWESPAEMRERALEALHKYDHLAAFLAVTHAGVIYALTGETDVFHADIVEMTLE